MHPFHVEVRILRLSLRGKQGFGARVGIVSSSMPEPASGLSATRSCNVVKANAIIISSYLIFT